MASYELDRSDSHRITFHENDPDGGKIILCFGFDGNAGMGARGFGSDFCDKNGWNHVYIGPKKSRFFDQLPAERLIEKLGDIVSGRDIVAYGTSLGGFASLWYGSYLNARILASSPRNPGHAMINPGAPAGTRPLDGYLVDAPRADASPLIIYDRTQRKDHTVVRDWVTPAYPDARVIHIANSGHQAMDRLRRAGVLSKFIRTFVNGEPIEEKATYFAEGTSGWYQDTGSGLLAAKRFVEARDMLWKALLHDPSMGAHLMPWLIAATAKSPASDADGYIRHAVSAGEIVAERLKGSARADLRVILTRG